MSKHETLIAIYELVGPLNRKNIPLGPDVTFAADLELDSMTVMDLVADIEDEFDIVLPLNLLPELETIAHVANAVDQLVSEKE